MASIPALPRRRGHRAETRILADEAELRSWARQALPGEVMDYAEGPWVPEGPTKAAVTALKNEGLATPHQVRIEADRIRYFVKRSAETPRATATTRSAPVGDPAEAKVLRALIDAAAAGARCPSDRALAEAANLGSRHQASWRVRKLAEAGTIGVETLTGPDGPWRVVTVGGRSTARPQAEQS